MKNISAIIMVVILLAGCQQEHNKVTSGQSAFKEFNGVDAGENGYAQSDNSQMDNQQKASLAAVLIYYGVPFPYENNKIFIPDSKLADLNYFYNITIKSKDSVWLKEHLLSKIDNNTLKPNE